LKNFQILKEVIVNSVADGRTLSQSISSPIFIAGLSLFMEINFKEKNGF